MLFAPNPPQRILQTFSVHSCHSALTSQHAGIIPSTVRSEPQAATQRFTISATCCTCWARPPVCTDTDRVCQLWVHLWVRTAAKQSEGRFWEWRLTGQWLDLSLQGVAAVDVYGKFANCRRMKLLLLSKLTVLIIRLKLPNRTFTCIWEICKSLEDVIVVIVKTDSLDYSIRIAKQNVGKSANW